VVPVLNEERHVAAALASAQGQDYPAELLEIIVADGGSTDRTRAIVAAIAAADPRVRLVDNPGRNQAAGLNVAIRQAKGDVVARLDGHAEWYPGHLRRCVAILEATGADNVGGTMEGAGENATADAVARAMRSPFAAGGATYRYGREQREVETVFLGCYRRQALERVGEFNEAFPPHEDYELNRRIVRSGGRIVYSPDLPTRYWARATWARLARQYFRYGEAKARVAREFPDVVRPYHVVPPALVASLPLALLACATRPGRRAVGAAAVAYTAAALAASARVSEGATPATRVRLPLVFPVVHLAWGAGFIAGRLRRQGRAGTRQPVSR